MYEWFQTKRPYHNRINQMNKIKIKFMNHLALATLIIREPIPNFILNGSAAINRNAHKPKTGKRKNTGKTW